MGSKTPPDRRPSNTEPQGPEIFDQPAPSEGSASKRILGRIAVALQLPPAAFHDAPAVAEGGPSGRHGVGFYGIADQCAALLRAFQHIRDPEERRRLLSLAQEAAART